MDATSRKRVTYKRICPNPLFKKWLEELHEEACNKNSNFKYVIKEALTSLIKYPIKIYSGKECAILHGFGKKLCAYLDKKLKERENSSASCLSSDSSARCSNKIEKSTECVSKIQKRKNNTLRKKTDSKYIPSYRSGAYAILLGLYKHGNFIPMSKEALIYHAQQYCEESFIQTKPESRYTTWSSMSSLLSKGLVSKVRHKKAEYLLTDEGCNLAIDLLSRYKNIVTPDDIITNHYSQDPFNSNRSNVVNPVSIKDKENEIPIDNNPSDELEELQISPSILVASQSNDEILYYTLKNGTFDVVLLVDKQETAGASKKDDPIVRQIMKYSNLKYEFRHLKVGDFTWIAKSRDSNEEFVLPYIVERKRMDDLGASIKDGRFHEQKFRLKNCGIPNVIYMIERYGTNKHVGLPLSSLMQATTNVRVQYGFMIHFTESLAHSVKFLAMMTKKLTIEYQASDLLGIKGDIGASTLGAGLMTFSYFNSSSSKTKPLTVTEMFIKWLLQLKGVSVDSALAITNMYDTPKALMDAYRQMDTGCETLLSNLVLKSGTRKVGTHASKAIHHLFTSQNLL